MTEPIKAPYMPTMDEAHRFIKSNPLTAASILVETQNLAREDSDTSNGRLREMWLLAGGSVDKKGRAWIELHLLPGLIRAVATMSKST